MSIDVDLKPTRWRKGRLWDARQQQRGDMLATWLSRHELQRTRTVPLVCPVACPCQIGTTVRSKRCNMLRLEDDGSMRHGSQWWHLHSPTADHCEMFVRGRNREVWTTEPYSYDEAPLVNLSMTFGLAVVVHPRSESSYSPGRTHLIAVMREEEVPRYLTVEPQAVLLVVGGVVAISRGSEGEP
jgi:hypothetical protein